MCSTAWPRSLPQFLLCPVEKGSWCFYVGICSKVGILSFLFCQLDWTLTPSLRLCLCSPCVPQLGHDPHCCFSLVMLRKAAEIPNVLCPCFLFSWPKPSFGKFVVFIALKICWCPWIVELWNFSGVSDLFDDVSFSAVNPIKRWVHRIVFKTVRIW